MSETTESQAPKETPTPIDLVIELAETKNALSEAYENIRVLSESVQRDNMIHLALQPVVDLIALWREQQGEPAEDNTPEVTIAEFAKGVAIHLGLFEEWKAAMVTRYDLKLQPKE